MRLVLLFLVTAVVAPRALHAQGGDGHCFYLSDQQGCDPYGNMNNTQWESCLSTCDDQLSACEGPSYFNEQGDDWNYTHGMSEGFKFGHISYQRHFFDYDHFYKCSREGECVCEPEDEGAPVWVFVCKSKTQFEWEDWTVKVYFDLECEAPDDDPPEDDWDDGGWDEEYQWDEDWQ